MQITFLKLGGSLITDKSQTRTALHSEIDRISQEIAHARKQMPEKRILLGNGAGSFAHQSAHMYGTMDGFSNEEGLYGACVTHQDAMRLNQIVIESLLSAQLPAFSVQPSAFISTRNKNINTYDVSLIETMLQKNYIPVIYGDVIADSEIGSTILSTDTLFRSLAEKLLALHHTVTIIHAGNYPGVLDEQGNVIAKITPESMHSITSLQTSEQTDVTGGMKLKVEEMVRLAEKRIESHIIDGTMLGAITKALLGESIGTHILPCL